MKIFSEDERAESAEVVSSSLEKCVQLVHTFVKSNSEVYARDAESSEIDLVVLLYSG